MHRFDLATELTWKRHRRRDRRDDQVLFWKIAAIVAIAVAVLMGIG